MSTLGKLSSHWQPAPRRKRLDPARLRDLVAQRAAETGEAVDLEARLLELADEAHGEQAEALVAEALIAVARGG